MHTTKIDITGRRFERLVVIEEAGKRRSGEVTWRCRCDCGVERIVGGSALRSGSTKSCGCWSEDRKTKHGAVGTPEYATWQAMKKRCVSRSKRHAPFYRDRGIEVCAEWRESFEAFLSYVGDRPSPAYSIDRIDNDGNYEPGNVRWATAKEQRMNQRRMP